jgi:hypothetical protein
MTRVLDGRTFLGHPGGMVGYLAALQADPAVGLAVVVLQNGLMGRPMALARAALVALGGPAAGGGRAAGANRAAADDAPEPDRTGVYRADADHPDADPLEIAASPDGPTLRWQGRLVTLEALGEGRYLAPDPDLDRFALRFEPADERPDIVWHGPTRFVRDGAAAPPLPAPDAAVAALAGHYRSHNPWTTNFRVILRGDVPWLLFSAAPDGFEDEQPLALRADGSFGIADDPGNPEDLRFDTVIDGRPLRAWLSGCPYYRVG